MSSTQDAGATVLPEDEVPSTGLPEAGDAQDFIDDPVEERENGVDNEPDTLPALLVDNLDELSSGPVLLRQDSDQLHEAEKDVLAQDPSVDETASIPDDTPSLRGSVLSSPRSEQARSIASPARNSSPSSPRRPFDRRFQSRLSTSSLLTPRPSSPAFLNAHSRHSSAGSFALPPPSEPDESAAPWEVIRWNKLRKLSGQAFSEVGKRNFGSPTCMAVTDALVIGTSRGMVLVFDHQQNNKAVIGAGTKALECGPVTALAISADHTTIAVGHATGHIYTWEIARPARPFLHIPPIDIGLPQAKRGDGHAENSAVIHVGFLAYRRTALVSADDKGMAFSHLATRGMGAVARSVKTTRILGRYPEVLSRPSAKPLKKSSVLAFAPLPLGNVEQKTDTLGLVAMLTPYLLVVVSTTPIAQTQHKAARPKEVAAHSAMTAALAWFPAIKLKGSETRTSNKLAYAWSNILTILEVHEVEAREDAGKEKPPELQLLPRNRYKAEEAIVAIQWLSRSILAVLTITQQLLIIEDVSMNVTDSFDLLPKNIYHSDLYSQQLQSVIESHDEDDTSMHGVVADAFHMSVRAYKGRLFLLGAGEVWWGSLTNWADRLLALMNVGDFIGAIRLATRYYSGLGEKVTIGLPDDKTSREMMVGEKLFEMMNASLKYAFGKNQQAGSRQIDQTQMTELAEAAIAACIVAGDQDFLFDTVFSWYDDHEQGGLFLDVLEPHILDGTIVSIPPPALKLLIDHFQTTHSPSELEKMICLLDTSSMDIDQVTTLCKKYNLYDAYIYVWNSALADFTSPLDELLQLAHETALVNGSVLYASRADNAAKIFPYLSYTLTGRVYPTETSMSDAFQWSAKSQIYDYFFVAVPKQTRNMQATRSSQDSIEPYSNLRRILKYDTPNFMSALNEGFEDTFLNSNEDDVTNAMSAQAVALQKTTYNRQFIVLVMLDVMSTGFTAEDTIYLDMFVSRNLPKYPQYMLLSGTALQDILTRLCHYPDEGFKDECQLSVEYLLSVFHPSNMRTVISLLHEAQFYRVLKTVYRQEDQFENVVRMYFEDDEDRAEVFKVICEFLDPKSSIPNDQRQAIRELLRVHAADLLELDIHESAATANSVAKELHSHFLSVLEGDEQGQYRYLDALYSADSRATAPTSTEQLDSSLLEAYVRLMCQFDPDKVSSYVENLKQGNLRLEEVLPAMEYRGVVDAAVILEAQAGKVHEAMKRLAKHLSYLGTALASLLSSDAASTTVQQSAEDLAASVDKYSKVGIWLCQGQSRMAQKARPTGKLSRRSSLLQQPLLLEETLWVDLIESIVSIARETSLHSANKLGESEEITAEIRAVIQQVFTALLTTTTSGRRTSEGAPDLAFLRILRAFLSNAAKTSPSLSELRNVIASIFSAYAHEQSLLSLSNAMLDKDVFVHLDNVKQLRQKGWRPRGQVCEGCRRKVWGPGLGVDMWEAWQMKEEARKSRLGARHDPEPQQLYETEGKGKGVVQSRLLPHDSSADGKLAAGSPDLGPIVVFSCRHIYHQKCLLGSEVSSEVQLNNSEQKKLACPACVATRT